MDYLEPDPLVDEDLIDPNGSLMDQIIDVLRAGGSFTVNGILHNVLMCTSDVHVQECIKDLETQRLVELVGRNPLRWQLAMKSPVHSTSSNQQIFGFHHPEENVSTSFPFENSQGFYPSYPGFGNPNKGFDAPGNKSLSTQKPHVGADDNKKQSYLGCPPPPSAELFKSLISQCKYPAAPVPTCSSTRHVTPPQRGTAASHSNPLPTRVTDSSSMQGSARPPLSHGCPPPDITMMRLDQPEQPKVQEHLQKQNNYQNARAPGQFPQPPSAQMFSSLISIGPQKTATRSAKPANQKPNLTALESKVLQFMRQTGKPTETLQISRAVGFKTKKDVNPSLYHLQSMGMMTKMHDQPPTWKIKQDKLNLVGTAQHESPQNHSGQQFFSRQERPAQENPAGIPSFPHNFVKAEKQNSHLPSNSVSGNRQAFDERLSQTVKYPGEIESKAFGQNSFSSGFSPQPEQQALSKVVHSAINQNPVSALNEYAQKNRLELTFEVINERRGFNKPPYTVVAVLAGQVFPSATSSTIKDARREACDVALRVILGQNLTPQGQSNHTVISEPTAASLSGARTHFDLIAALSQHAFVQIAAAIPDNIAGRKVVACIVMQRGSQDTGLVVSLGSGNRCVTGQRLSMEGKVVNDSHAEIVARRSLHRFFYSQVNSFHEGQESIFEQMNNTSRLSLKGGISFHLYISTAPCGDGALFTPRLGDILTEPTHDERGGHRPEFSSKPQGILRTKIEDGEGTIPIDPNDGPQTWDGLLRGQRLRTMSCSDKICRWNVVGLQGAILSHFIEPIYLKSLTLGYLYDHGHLSRAVCCRLEHKINDLGVQLPKPFRVNHPLLGRVTAYEATRHTEKTNNLSVNWTYGDTSAEVIDGRTGACLSRTNNSPTPSRICKAALYKSFKELCVRTKRQDLLNVETYRQAKDGAEDFQRAKHCMYECFRKSKYGSWVSKPAEQELF